MLFPVSGVEVPVYLPFLAGFLVAYFCSMGGISGAFLLLPFQVSFLGYTAPSVSATNQFFNIVATPGGVWRYGREGRLMLPLAMVCACATLPGVVLGTYIRLEFLSDTQTFMAFAALVLLFVGGRLLWDLRGTAARPAPGTARPQRLQSPWYKPRFLYRGEEFTYSVPSVVALTGFIGVIGGMYGVGGGSLLSPFLVAFFGLPVYVVAGPTLLCTLMTSVAGVLCYTFFAPYYPSMSVLPDYALGLLMGCGGLVGMYAGARTQKFLPQRPIKALVAGLALLTALVWGLKAFN